MEFVRTKLLFSIFWSFIPLSTISFFPAEKGEKKRMPLQSGLGRFLVLGFVLSFLLISSQVFSQNDNLKNRPKIGLVLSGGGAKGFAHIGVLKVLEEAGVKVDYIGGTSMGAVIGGLYASGYSAKQIDSVFKNTNFDELLNDYIPRTSKNFYERKNDELYAITLPFNRFRVGIPTALSRGMYNYALLNKLTSSVRNIRDFKKLPIPFLCIASDIETGEEVVLDSGYLAKSMLASSAFPTLFSPVEINGRLLVDGGVTNNYPTDRVREMGADIIIGVDVQDDLKGRKNLQDATRILVQISNLDVMGNMKDKVAATEIYIKPDITAYSVLSFDQGEGIIKQGEEAARLQFDKLRAIGGDPIHQKNYPSPLVNDSINVGNIIINRMANYTRAYVIGKLKFKQDSKISYKDLAIGIDNLAATQNFSGINYELDLNDDMVRDDLFLVLTENPNTTFLKFALHFDGLYKSGILLNLTQKKTLFKNDVTSLDVVLGDNFRYNLDYYLDNGFYLSIGVKSRYNSFSKNSKTDFNSGNTLASLGVNSINIDYEDFTNQLYFQTLFIQTFSLGVGAELQHLTITSETTKNFIPKFEDSNYFSLFGTLKFDSFDNRYFPHSGYYFSGDFHSYLFSSDYTNSFDRFAVAKADMGIARRITPHLTGALRSEGGFALGGTSPQFFNFVLGGYGFNAINNFRPFFGYDFLSLSADSYVSASLNLDYEIFRRNHINLTGNFANIENNIFETGNWLSAPSYTGYAVGYGLETIAGPVEAKYSWSSETGKGFLWFSIGFWF